MKMLNKKNSIKKVMLILICLILFNVICPTYSRAEWWGGGTLFEPIKDLVCAIGDGVINLLQNILLPNAPQAIDKTSVSEWSVEQYKKAGDTGMTIIGTIANGASRIPFLGNAIVRLDDAILSGLGITEEGYIESFYDIRVVSCIMYGPATIFSNLVPALDVNFINPKVYFTGGEIETNIRLDRNGFWEVYTTYIENAQPSSQAEREQLLAESNTAYQLRDTIATWYTALRNIAIVGLLSILVYVGIRIIISSTAGETAKYKSMLKDWLVAMCLVFLLHYIMAFMLRVNDLVIDLFADNVTVGENTSIEGVVSSDVFMNQTRNLAELEGFEDEDGNVDEDMGLQFGFALMYLILVFYTLIFTWKYLKRFVYLAFLTLISPLVALSYPIDKLRDGSAQAFNMWFKEYIFNVLIQPLHLLLYSILVSSALEFAQNNMIYAIVALGFLLEAEKIFKSLFGFDKAKGGTLSSAVTGGAIFGAVAGAARAGISKIPGGRGGKGSSQGSLGSGSGGGSKVRFNDRKADAGAPKGLSAFATNSANSTNSIKAASSTPGIKGANFNNANINPKAPKNLKSSKTSVGNLKGTNLNVKGKNLNLPKSSGNKKNSVIRGIKAGSGRAFTSAKKLALKGGKLGLIAAGAATLGTLGLAAGIASDNPGDVLKYAGMGAGAGALLGKKIPDAANAVAGGVKGIANEAGGIKQSFQQGYYQDKDEYQQKVNQKLDKQWENDKDVIKHFKQEYGEADYKQKMQEALELRKAGITEQSEIDAALKLKDKNPGVSIDQAANIVQFTQGLDKRDLLNSDTRENLRKQALKVVGNDAAADRIMDLAEQKLKLK